MLYEEWLERRDPAILDDIAAYNEEDCVSTLQLRDWLLPLRPGAAPRPEPSRSRASRREGAAETEELRAALLAGLPDDPHEVAERRPAALAARAAAPLPPPRGEAGLVGVLRQDRADERGAAGARLRRDRRARAGGAADRLGRVARLAVPLPGAAAPPRAGERRLRSRDRRAGREDRGARRRGGHALAAARADARGRAAAGGADPRRAVRRRRSSRPRCGGSRARCSPATRRYRASQVDPRRASRSPSPLPQDDLEAAKELVAGLDGRHLVIQGPPGSGKTYTGARLIVHLMSLGRRVGVTATSHKAIHNLLAEVEKAAREQGVAFRGLKKGDSYEGAVRHDLERTRRTSREPDDDVLLLAGTAWLFAREDMAGVVDTLFVDEAGQVSLADALALGTCARNVVLLGDPQQLAQVSQGIHPEGAAASVLEHLLGDEDTVPPDRGLFLSRTWRMHPDVCRFISETSYEGRLHSVPDVRAAADRLARPRRDRPALAAGRARGQPRLVGRGGRPDRRRARAAASAARSPTATAASAGSAGTTSSSSRPTTRRCAACARGSARAPAIGTVDKFQGQEAPVVFFSMATSSGDDLPRNLEFLFSRNRLNVAISRAQSLAVLVASPKLLEIRCRTIEQMRMVNALCRFVEEAD